MRAVVFRWKDFRSLQEALHHFKDAEALAEGVAVVHHVGEMIVLPVLPHVEYRILRINTLSTLVLAANDLSNSNGNGACSC